MSAYETLSAGPIGVPTRHPDQDEYADKIAKLLSDPREWVRETGKGALAAVLRLACYPTGHPMAALAETAPGFHRINEADRAKLMRTIPAGLASSNPSSHALARERLAMAMGSYMLDMPE
jgi:hypothetical protein